MNEITVKVDGIEELKHEMKKLRELVTFMQENNLPKYISFETIEEKFNIANQTIKKLHKKGKLKKYKLSERKIYFSTQEIYSLIESNQVKEFEPKP